jgi:hypothetical protein
MSLESVIECGLVERLIQAVQDVQLHALILIKWQDAFSEAEQRLILACGGM